MDTINPVTQSAPFSTRALEEMEIRGIPATPENYTVWYTHISGSRADLSDHLSQLISAKVTFDQQLCKEIYHQYFGDGFQTLMEELRRELGRIVNIASQDIDKIGQEITSYSHALEGYSDRIAKIQASNMLGDLINQLITRTRTTYQSTHQTGASLSVLSNDISQLREQVEKLSRETYTDQLTTVSNRRHFEEEYQKLFSMARLRGYSFSLILLDIDNFKQFNDTYGHAVGDLVLRFVGKMLKDGTKGQDIVARYGGEEFVILLPDTNYPDAIKLANNLCKRISAKPLTADRTGQKSFGHITASCGIAYFDDSDTPETLFKRTDDCLYEAKRRGRDCCVGEQEYTPKVQQ